MRLGLDADLRRFRAERPPVLLLGGLNLVRPLGVAGIPVVVASPDPHTPAMASRYCSGRCLLPPLESPEAVLETLVAAGDRLASALGRPVPLFYGNDDYLNLVYAFRDDLARHFLLLLNEPEVARALIEKDRFEALARDRGLVVPRTLSWDDASPDALSRAEGPVLVKPKVTMRWDESPVHLQLFGGEGKALVFENGRALRAHPVASQLKDQLTVQEFIPGGDDHLWSFHGFADEKGNLLDSFIGRKLRTFPALTGASTFLRLTHDDELTAIGRDIVARLPLKGVFKIDLKRDAGNGRFHVLEINARFNLWHYMGAWNGVNLPQVAYDYLVHGARPARTPIRGQAGYRTTFRWLDFRLDYLAFRQLASRGELSAGGWLGSLLLSRKVYSLFSWTDPFPYLRLWGERLTSRLRPWRSTAS